MLSGVPIPMRFEIILPFNSVSTVTCFRYIWFRIRTQRARKPEGTYLWPNIIFFLNIYPPFCICCLVFGNFDFDFVISDPKNLKIPSPDPIWCFFKISVRHFGSTIFFLQFRLQICNQRPWKPRDTRFSRNQKMSLCFGQL